MKERLLALWNWVKGSPAAALGVLAGIVLLVAKFSSLLMSLTAWSAKRDLDKTVDKDAELKRKQDEANAKADALVDESERLGRDGNPDDDWYKKR